jgi:23S rRNA pseudouridine2605 synthase
VISVGRLDITSEGLLLLTNDGALARRLELPANAWIRRYRARAFGAITQAELDQLAQGVEIAGIRYGPIHAELDRQQGANAWITVSLTEGKNREVRRVLEAMGLRVNRLIRTAYGPFQLGELAPGAVDEAPGKVLREQLGLRPPKTRKASQD